MKRTAPRDGQNLPQELFMLSCELRGLSELFAHQRFQDPAADIDECLEGLGSILRGMGERLRLLYVQADSESCARKKKI